MIELNMERTGLQIEIKCSHHDKGIRVNTREFLTVLDKFLNQLDSYSDVDIHIVKPGLRHCDNDEDDNDE